MAGVILLLLFWLVELALFGALGYLTWRVLWREARTPYEVVVYQKGVRGWGLTMWILMSVAWPVIGSEHPAGLEPLVFTLASDLLHAALIGFPLWMWGGYWWGRAMARFAGLRPPPSRA